MSYYVLSLRGGIGQPTFPNTIVCLKHCANVQAFIITVTDEDIEYEIKVKMFTTEVVTRNVGMNIG